MRGTARSALDEEVIHHHGSARFQGAKAHPVSLVGGQGCAPQAIGQRLAELRPFHFLNADAQDLGLPDETAQDR